MLVTREMLRLMKPRTVVMDLAIDMGGCFETSRPTSLREPELRGGRHPARVHPEPAVGRRARLDAGPDERRCCRTSPTVADEGIEAALRRHPELARGTYLYRGHCTSEVLARTFGVEWRRLPEIEG